MVIGSFLNDAFIDIVCVFLGCEDDDEEIRRLSFGIYKSCWMLAFLEENCLSHSEWAEHCPYSCGLCEKRRGGIKILLISLAILYNSKNIKFEISHYLKILIC